MSEGFAIEKKVLKKYDGPGGAVVIPEGVEEIGYQAFKGRGDVTSVEFPKGLNRLRKEAFADCTGLSRLVLPEGLTGTGTYTFKGCTALASVVLPESLTVIDDSAFKDCTALQEINFPKSLKTISHAAFRNCAALPDPILPEGLESIGWYAFKGCKAMESLLIPASVRHIEGEIVRNTSIKKVILLGDVQILNRDAFSCYSGELEAFKTPVGRFGSGDKHKAVQTFAKTFLDGIALDPDITSGYLDYIRKRRKDLYGVALEDRNLMILMVREQMIPQSQLQEVLDQCAKAGKTELTALLLEYGKRFPPADPIREAEKGFQAMEREAKAVETYRQTGILTVALAKQEWIYGSDGEKGLSLNGWKGEGSELTTPKGIGRKPVTEIGPNAFFRSKLTRITISEGVRYIQDGAFWNCKQLTAVTLPKSLEGTGNSVFMNCAALKEIKLPGKLKRIGSSTFSGCESLTAAVVPKKVKEIAWCAFANCHSLEQVTIPASVIDISLSAFVDCPKLTIYAPAGSYAETFARRNNIPFAEL